jgi:16S rRNA G1207 methylase RsmC
MSVHIPAILARLVRKRAGNACEYCRLPQSSQEATFHVDHIRPAVAQGATIGALGMNRPAIVSIRRTLAALGRFPPP